MNIGFFIRHFTERGTEVSAYDYALYNETVLQNKSYIICFTQAMQQRYGFPIERYSYDKFKRFEIIEINDMIDMKYYIQKHNLSFFYTQTHGGLDIYRFHEKYIWGNCKTIKHCVFDTTCPEGDFYISISKMLTIKNNTNIPVIPYIVDLPEVNDDLRDTLNIPRDVIVFGRHGGMDQFDIPMTHDAIKEHLELDSTCYFLFMSTQPFYDHPRIIYLDRNVDLHYKVKFINTCDAMIHARSMGEIFGLSIGEFSLKNKPIITCTSGDIEHIDILGDKALLYQSKEDILHLFKNIKSIIQSRQDWNAYRNYNPENVMALFQDIFKSCENIII